MAPDLLAIHYHPSVELNFSTFTDEITVDSCTASLRGVPYRNVIGFTLSSCTGTPAYLNIGNATLFTNHGGPGGYVSSETDVAMRLEMFSIPAVASSRSWYLKRLWGRNAQLGSD